MGRKGKNAIAAAAAAAAAAPTYVPERVATPPWADASGPAGPRDEMLEQRLDTVAVSGAMTPPRDAMQSASSSAVDDVIAMLDPEMREELRERLMMAASGPAGPRDDVVSATESVEPDNIILKIPIEIHRWTVQGRLLELYDGKVRLTDELWEALAKPMRLHLEAEADFMVDTDRRASCRERV